ncbi:MAG: 50S ribosomal protein L23 [Gammaproteobacteria bacterium]|nr:50S ribosomal protein L23 [Gammaproteobacteria bacterium]
MNIENKFIVLREPHTSEKSTVLADKLKHFVFKVSPDATKLQIKTAVEAIFNVKVEKVSTVVVKGKNKRFRGRPGKRNDWKKAYVALQDGFDLDFASVD